jgi:uncharacterized membrane protein YdcZ (DUF606 family)
MSSATLLTRTAAGLALASSAVHAGLVQEHLREWWGYGAFFVVASIAQGIFGLLLLALPERPHWEAQAWRHWRRRLYLAGIAGNLAMVALYVVTRTSGIPWLGPEAGSVESVAAIDLLSKAAELGVVACLAVLYRSAGHEAPDAGVAPARAPIA